MGRNWPPSKKVTRSIHADGAKLAVYSPETKVVMIWDLAQVRRQLAALGLDWDALALPTRNDRLLLAPSR